MNRGPARAVQVVRQALQTSRLRCIEGAVAFRVVANQHFAEGWPEGLDMPGEIFAVFEIEFVLPALLDAAGGRVVVCRRVAEDGGAELLVGQDARFLLRHAVPDRGLEAIVDHLLGCGDFGRLIGRQRALPAEHLRLERVAVVEGQDVERFVETGGPHAFSLSCR